MVTAFSLQSKRLAMRRSDKDVKTSATRKSTSGLYAFGSSTSRMVGPLEQRPPQRAASHSVLASRGGGVPQEEGPSLPKQRRATSACNLSPKRSPCSSTALKHGTYACPRACPSTISRFIHIILRSSLIFLNSVYPQSSQIILTPVCF